MCNRKHVGHMIMMMMTIAIVFVVVIINAVMTTTMFMMMTMRKGLMATIVVIMLISSLDLPWQRCNASEQQQQQQQSHHQLPTHAMDHRICATWLRKVASTHSCGQYLIRIIYAWHAEMNEQTDTKRLGHKCECKVHSMYVCMMIISELNLNSVICCCISGRRSCCNSGH